MNHININSFGFTIIGALLLYSCSIANCYGQYTSLSDAGLYEDAPSYNSGSDATLFIGKSSTGSRYFAVIKFDISSIPSNATITNAFITLSRNTSMPSESVSGYAYRITSGNWSESTINWNSVSSLSWDSSVGGNLNASSSSSTTTITVYSIVKKWVEEGYQNYGFIIMPGSSSSVGNDWFFRSKESSTGKPTLTVYYCTPSTSASSITISANPVCPGSSVTLTRSGGSLGTNASWEWYSGSCGGTSIGSGNSISVNPNVNTTYYVRAEGDCNTTTCVSTSVSMKALSTAPTSITASSNSINPGTSVTLTKNGGTLGSGALWRWYSSSCGGAFLGEGNSIVVSPTESTTFYVRAEGDCNQTACASTSVTVTPVASIGSVTGKTPICIGETTTYTANSVVLSGGTGAWSSSNSAIASVNSSGNVTGISAGECNIIYTITGGYGGTVSKAQSVTVNQNASISSVSGPNQVCIGGSGTFTANGVVLGGGGTGSWSSNNTSVATVSSSGVVTGVTPGTCSIVYTIINGCGGTKSASQALTVNQNNSITLTSSPGTNNQTTCKNSAISNILYSTTGATGASFTGLPSGVTGSWANNMISISGSPSASGSYNYTISLTGGCGTTTANGSITVTQDNTVTLSSAPGTSSQSICVNTAIAPITYTTTGATGALFSGLPPGITGSWAANAISINGVVNTIGTFPFSVTLTGGCGSTTNSGTIVSNPDAAISSVTGPALLCVGESGNFVANGAISGGGSISWTSTDNTTAIVDGAGSVTGISPGSCTITYTITGGCGGTVAEQQSLTIIPSPTGSADFLTVCSGELLDYNLQESNVNQLGNSQPSTFSWVAASNSNVSGTSIIPKLSTIINDRVRNISGADQTVLYTVTPTGTNGCSGNPFTISVTVRSEPLGVDATIQTCSGKDLAYNLQTSNINVLGNSQLSSFIWKAASNNEVEGESTANITTGQINDIIINNSGKNQHILYSVIPTGLNGCSGAPFIVTASVNPLPEIFLKWEDVIICSNVYNLFQNYQWYRDDSPISGATNQYYSTSKQSGIYKVETTDLNGCRNMSNELNISGSMSLNLYPNPANSSFSVSLSDGSLGKAIISIVNNSGVKVKEFQTEKVSQELHREIEVSDLIEGTYFVVVSINNTVKYYSKIVIIKSQRENNDES